MKRMLVFVLAVVMVMSMAVPAAAASLGSPAAQKADLKPVLTKESEIIVDLHTTEDVKELNEEAQELMAESKKSLKDACPKGLAVKYFFYVEITGTENAVAIEFEPIANKEVVVMQFVDGKWVELKFTINEDGIITVAGVVEGPIAIFVK